MYLAATTNVELGNTGVPSEPVAPHSLTSSRTITVGVSSVYGVQSAITVRSVNSGAPSNISAIVALAICNPALRR